MTEEPEPQEDEQRFLDRRMGYGTRRGCLIVVLVLIFLLVIAVLLSRAVSQWA